MPVEAACPLHRVYHPAVVQNVSLASMNGAHARLILPDALGHLQRVGVDRIAEYQRAFGEVLRDPAQARGKLGALRIGAAEADAQQALTISLVELRLDPRGSHRP